MKIFLLTALLGCSLLGQEPSFDVASIKPSASVQTGSGIHNSLGGFKTTNTSLHELIRYALGAQGFQIAGGPAWIKDARFDISATNDKAEEELSLADRKNGEIRIARIRKRLLKLLVERFQLELREEQREVPVYALSVDKGGPRMKAVAIPLGNVNMNTDNGGGSISGKGMTMTRLGFILSGIVERPVTDETGLQESFDIELKYSLDLAAPESGAVVKDGAQQFPSLFTAVREQLGLRLTPKKGMAPVWVVVRAEKPGEN